MKGAQPWRHFDPKLPIRLSARINQMVQKYADGLAWLYQARFAPTELAAKESVWTVLCHEEIPAES